MDQIFLVIVAVLFILAIADLIVGVSNDAVNFLNSAIGAKVASYTTIMVVAIAGILVGTLFSSGMMEIARSGVFYPSHFYFSEIMYIFLAVMITDILLLDTFSSFGMPTSTTVSIIFELLGAAVAVAMMKTLTETGSIQGMGQYINSGKALAIISGILLSVVLAFAFGSLVQYISRLIFTFRFHTNARYLGGLWGGFAITAITYFMVIKGAKGASFMDASTVQYIESNALWILLVSMAAWTLIFQLLIWAFHVDVIRITVLVGTFALAMAFAGNDLVNFIGVPLAGFEAFRIFSATPGASPDSMYMEALMHPIVTPWYMLLLAGVVMSLTLLFSRKARTVINTSVDLSRQEEGTEKFASNALSRSIVRSSVNTGRFIDRILPQPVKSFMSRRFEAPAEEEMSKAKSAGISFDVIRASVNLVVASILIAMGTSMKLPLSTTYVTFMVAMGTSFADGAWGRESAVYRISGVLAVIGGWFVTAFVAFCVSFLMGWIIFKGEMIAITGLLILTAIILIRQQRAYLRRERDAEAKKGDTSLGQSINTNEMMERCKQDVVLSVDTAERLYTRILTALYEDDRKKLRNLYGEVNRLGKSTKKQKDNVHALLTRLRDDSIEAGHYYVQSTDFLREIANCLHFITEPALSHIENNHRGLVASQTNELASISQDISRMFLWIKNTLESGNLKSQEQLAKLQESVLEDIDKARKAQIRRIKSNETGIKNSLLYLNILSETRNLAIFAGNLTKSFRDFELASQKKN